MSDPIYYHITGGPVLKSIEKFQTFYREETAKQGDICKQFGAISVWGNSSGISGLLFEKDAKPKGWVKASKNRSDVFKPNGRTSDGKAQMAILRSGCVPDAHSFQHIVTGVDNVFMFLAKNDLRVRVLGYELIGGATTSCTTLTPKAVSPSREGAGKCRKKAPVSSNSPNTGQ